MFLIRFVERVYSLEAAGLPYVTRRRFVEGRQVFFILMDFQGKVMLFLKFQ